MEREKIGSRLGFLLLSAGCAIGIGNIWRFPYVTGQYGGGFFVLFYLLFLVGMGIPIMSMEFSVGRASKKSVADSFRALEKPGQKWHLFSYAAMLGNYLLMMFYTVVAGWMLAYFWKMATGEFTGIKEIPVEESYQGLISSPGSMVFWTLLVIFLGLFICSFGLQKGVERMTKIMMIALMGIMLVLAIHSFVMPGAKAGLQFYLKPDFARVQEAGLWNVITAAMNQAFFTLSIGIGSMAIFGSYLGKEQSLLGESVRIAGLDTFVALVAGMIIFPACYSYGVAPDSGPSLIFITLPKLFQTMAGGRIWGSLFFVFMSFAALSTVIAVFENILAFGMDLFGWSRKKSVGLNLILLSLGSLPCALGFNLLSGIHPLGGESTFLDLYEFLVSNILLPLGSLVYLLFCTRKKGWGYENYLLEVNQGKGAKMRKYMEPYLSYLLPLLLLGLFFQGMISKFI